MTMMMMFMMTMKMVFVLAMVAVWMTLACGIFLLAAARVRSRNLVTNVISVARTMTVAFLTLTMFMMLKKTPCSEEYLPVEEEDEHEGEEEGGAGGEDLVGQLLAHLDHINDKTKTKTETNDKTIEIYAHNTVSLVDSLLPGGVLPSKERRQSNHCDHNFILYFIFYI